MNRHATMSGVIATSSLCSNRPHTTFSDEFKVRFRPPSGKPNRTIFSKMFWKSYRRRLV